MRSASAARMSSRCSPRRTSPASPPEEKVSQYRYDPTAFRQVFEHHFTFLDGFLRNVHRYAGRLGAEVDALAAGLAARGAGPGDVITFQLYNCPEFALVYLAAQRLGGIASP